MSKLQRMFTKRHASFDGSISQINEQIKKLILIEADGKTVLLKQEKRIVELENRDEQAQKHRIILERKLMEAITRLDDVGEIINDIDSRIGDKKVEVTWEQMRKNIITIDNIFYKSDMMHSYLHINLLKLAAKKEMVSIAPISGQKVYEVQFKNYSEEIEIDPKYTK